jgi:hypothetical protein
MTEGLVLGCHSRTGPEPFSTMLKTLTTIYLYALRTSPLYERRWVCQQSRSKDLNYAFCFAGADRVKRMTSHKLGESNTESTSGLFGQVRLKCLTKEDSSNVGVLRYSVRLK